MVTIAHCSDWHQSYKSGRLVTAQGINAREADGYLALKKLIGEVIAENIDVLIVAGDIFHTPTPDVRAIVFVQNQLLRLWRAGVKVYMLAGNHDTNDVRGDIAASRILNDPAKDIYSYVEPYVEVEVAPNVFLHMISHHLYNEQASTMASIKPRDNAINILSTHGSCVDPLLKIKLHTEQSPREIVLPDELIADHDWDYVMLGHIHERGYPGSKDGIKDTTGRKIFYNGSLIRRGFSDKEVPLGRGWTKWTIDEEGVFTPEYKTIPQRPQQDFPIIDAKKLSSREISDIIVNNLEKTQLGDGKFNLSTAPMLRQQIKNIENNKYSALDWNNISANSKHAFSWNIQVINKSIIDPTINVKEVDLDSLDGESNDVVSIYDDWTSKSKQLETLDESTREIVKTDTRRFIELGQEVTLNE